MVFSRNPVEGECKWGEHALPRLSNYTYLGIDFACNGAWDVQVCGGMRRYAVCMQVCDNCKKKVNRLHSVISNRDINLNARRLLLLSVVRPSLEYGSEIWDCTFESFQAHVTPNSFITCFRRTPKSGGIRLPDNRYPKQLLSQEWEIKPRKGRQTIDGL